MDKAARKQRKKELFEQALKDIQARNVDFPGYNKKFAELRNEGVSEEAAAREAHKLFIDGRLPGIQGKKLRFMAKTRADQMLKAELANVSA